MSQGDTKFFCLELASFPRPTQFVVSSVFVLVLFLVYGYTLELLFRLEGMREHSWYLTLVQFFYYTLFCVFEKLVTGHRKQPLSRKQTAIFLLLAFLTVSTIGLSNMAVGYLNYPTQVIFKCCKLIPVMIGGILIQGKRYSLLDFVACLAMTCGLIFFTLADSKVQPTFNVYGVVIICGALCADAVIGNVQEKTMKEHSVLSTDIILYSYSIGFVYILVGLTFSGDLSPSFSFFAQYPVQTYGYAVIFSLTGYLGVNAILLQVKLFGALAAVTVTTFRKMVTIVLSFLLFSKPFTFRYLWSGLIVVLGIYLNVYSKNKAAMDHLFKQLLSRARPAAGRTLDDRALEMV